MSHTDPPIPRSLRLVGVAWGVVLLVALACAAVPLGFLSDSWRGTAVLIANLLQLGLPAALLLNVVLVGAALLSGAWTHARKRHSVLRAGVTLFGPPFAVVGVAGILVAVLVGFVNVAGMTGQLP